MCSHMSERITLFTIFVTQLCAWPVENGGWSESWKRGVTQVTGGRAFASMSSRIVSTERMCSCHRSVWNTFETPL